MGGVPDVITCARFQIEIFMGYDFTGGRIFDFPIDFSMGLTTVQRYCAACDPRVTDGRTDGQTSCHSIVRAIMHTRRAVEITIFDQYLALSRK